MFRAHVNEDCYDILVNQYGLPIMGWTNPDDPTKASNPSFDKQAMKKYMAHPYAPHDVVKRIIEYRKLSTFISFFVRPYQELQVGGVLYPTYNQTVRTGRMSAKKPNPQQLDKNAKALVHPEEGHTFVSMDYAQIEFRTIVHYINDEDCIAAYARDPDTDFHAWVAEMIEIARRPAKTCNFLMGYGGGKELLITQLAQNMELVGHLKDHVDKLLEQGKIKEENKLAAFELLCRRKAESVYNQYHATLPGLKQTSYRAAAALKHRGYVFNLYGRHRHLPDVAAHRAFNTLNQSTAADLLKERTVAVAKLIDHTPIKIIALVHDETLFSMPHSMAQDFRTIRDIVACLEAPSITLKVPVRIDVGLSETNWAIASGDDGKIKLPRDSWGEPGKLFHLVENKLGA
jgi:DNA polymerase-1